MALEHSGGYLFVVLYVECSRKWAQFRSDFMFTHVLEKTLENVGFSYSSAYYFYDFFLSNVKFFMQTSLFVIYEVPVFTLYTEYFIYLCLHWILLTSNVEGILEKKFAKKFIRILCKIYYFLARWVKRLYSLHFIRRISLASSVTVLLTITILSIKMFRQLMVKCSFSAWTKTEGVRNKGEVKERVEIKTKNVYFFYLKRKIAH